MSSLEEMKNARDKLDHEIKLEKQKDRIARTKAAIGKYFKSNNGDFIKVISRMTDRIKYVEIEKWNLVEEHTMDVDDFTRRFVTEITLKEYQTEGTKQIKELEQDLKETIVEKEKQINSIRKAIK